MATTIFLSKCWKKINFSDNDVLYILGDCCDRGPDSLKNLFIYSKI